MPELVVELSDNIERYQDTIPCHWIICGGLCEASDFTTAEAKEYGCGRDSAPNYGCCVASFTCTVCGTRYIGTKLAPDMDEDRYYDSEDD